MLNTISDSTCYFPFTSVIATDSDIPNRQTPAMSTSITVGISYPGSIRFSWVLKFCSTPAGHTGGVLYPVSIRFSWVFEVLQHSRWSVSPSRKWSRCIHRDHPDVFWSILDALGKSIRVLFRSSSATEHSPWLEKPKVQLEHLVDTEAVVIVIPWRCYHFLDFFCTDWRVLFRSFSTTEHLPCLSSRQLRSRW